MDTPTQVNNSLTLTSAVRHTILLQKAQDIGKAQPFSDESRPASSIVYPSPCFILMASSGETCSSYSAHFAPGRVWPFAFQDVTFSCGLMKFHKRVATAEWACMGSGEPPMHTRSNWHSLRCFKGNSLGLRGSAALNTARAAVSSTEGRRLHLNHLWTSSPN